jgi:RND family efflux transporter MFP subunit
VIGKDAVDKLAAERDVAEAGLKVAQALVAGAQLNLDFTRVTAPVEGRIGRAQVDAGNLVTANGDGTLLATIVSVDPIYVYFDLDQRSVLRLRDRLRGREIKDAEIPVQVRADGEKDFGRKGLVTFLDNRADPANGTLRARAVLTNRDEALRPGQFAVVRLALDEPHRALLVADAILAGEKGKEYVFVVNNKNELERRAVRIGALHGKLREIVAGLKTDDWVLVSSEGILKLGDKVEPTRTAMPEDRAPRSPAATSGHGAAAPVLPGTGPALVISTSCPGFSAEQVQALLAAPLEQRLSGLDGLAHTFTSCADGELHITLVLQKGTDLNRAQAQAEDHVKRVLSKLAPEIKELSASVKRRSSDLLGVALVSPDGSRDRAFLTQQASRLRDDLGRIDAVAKVEFLTPAEQVAGLYVDIDRDKLAMLGIELAEVNRLLQDANPARQANADALGGLVLKAEKDGRVIYLRDVAKIERVRRWPVLCTLDGRPCVLLQVQQAAGANAAETVRAVQARLAELAKQFPAGVEARAVVEE